VGNRSKGDKSRDGRDRRTPAVNWSSTAEFGDEVIDRPTPLSGRRDRGSRSTERTPRQPERTTRRSRSDTAGWATISPAEVEPDEPETGRGYVDSERNAGSWRDEAQPRLSEPGGRRNRAADDIDDEPRRRRGRYADDPPQRPYDAEPRRGYGIGARRDDEPEPRGYDPEPTGRYELPSRGADLALPAETEPRRSGRAAEDPPRRSRRSVEESPRRSRRAIEESTRRARPDDEPRRGRRAAPDDDPRGPRRFDEDTEPRGLWRDDEPRRPGRFDDDTSLRSFPVGDDEPRRGWRAAPDDEPRALRRADRDEHPRSLRSLNGDDEPRRGRRAAADDEPRRLRRGDDDSPRYGRNGYGVAPTPREPDDAWPSGRDTLTPGTWRTGDTASTGSSLTDGPGVEPWRSGTGVPDSGTGTFNGFTTGSVARRAIGSGTSGASAELTDAVELDTWRTETGTWRTRGTAETGSWRVPPPDSGIEDTGAWRTSSAPETGSWSRSRGQFVPKTDDTGEQPAFTVRRFDDTGEIPKELMQAARSGRVLDHDDFYDAGRRLDGADTGRRLDGADTGRRLDGGTEGRAGRRRRAVEDDGIDGGFDERRDQQGGRPPISRTDDRRGARIDGRGTERDRASDRAIDDRIGDRAAGRGRIDDQADDRPARRSRTRSAGGFGDLADDPRDRTEEWPPPGGRRAQRTVSTRSDERTGDYGDRRPSGYGRYDDDDAPRYRAGRKATGEYRSARHSSVGLDQDEERRPARGPARRGSAGPRAGESVITPRASGHRELVRVAPRPDIDEDDEEGDEIAYGYASAGLASVGWFGLPVGAFLLWAVLLGGTARADCVGAAGRPCPAPREAAFTTFSAHLPQIGVAIVLSVLVALLIRLVTPFWRPATVGFAGSVVGAGVTTVLFTVLNS
jgi:hypothetical protein